jgi:hypothetical protein
MAEWKSDLVSPIPDVSDFPLDRIAALDDALFTEAIGHILRPCGGNELRLWDQGNVHRGSGH